MTTVIRRSTFETNSSSVHTLIIIPHDMIEQWRELGDDWWIDLRQTEEEAEISGEGYGEIDGIAAVASLSHLVRISDVKKRGEWRVPDAYQDDIDANWVLPLDVIDRPDVYNRDYWSIIDRVWETDEGFCVSFN